MIKSLEDLKHSIRCHLLIMGGPSQQLCAFLVKTIDLLEDNDEERREEETSILSFSIIEAIALHVQKAIDERAKVAKEKENPMPENVRIYSDKILITIGKVRSHSNKLEAKQALLNIIGKSLDLLSTFTGAVYPTLFQLDGTQINNLEIKDKTKNAGALS